MIRQAIREDIPTIMSIVRSAQCALAELGIDQWQDGYPSAQWKKTNHTLLYGV